MILIDTNDAVTLNFSKAQWLVARDAEWRVPANATVPMLYRFARAAIQDARGWVESAASKGKRPNLLRVTELLCEADHYRALARVRRAA